MSSPYWSIIFTIWTSNDWSNNWSSRNCCKRLWIAGLPEKECILCIMEWSAQKRRPRRVEFCGSFQLIPCAGSMQVRKPLWTESSRSVIRSPQCFPHTDSRYQEKPKVSLLVIHGFFLFFLSLFCVRSIRIEVQGVSAILSSRIPRLKALILSNTGWPVSFNRSTIYLIGCTSFRLQDPATSSVLARIFSRIP